MALDKLVDSSQLDSDLTSVANAIRAKTTAAAPGALYNIYGDVIDLINGEAPIGYSEDPPAIDG